MKRIISAVLAVLICVLTLGGCEKTPTVQESSSGSSFAESDEASVSEVGAENSESEEGITPCTEEETLAFIETDEAKEQAASYIEWIGATNFSGEKDFIEGNISTLLGWFEDEIYAAAGEDSYNEREQYLLIPGEIAKECLYRHFGVYDFNPSDYFYSPETDSYIVHKEHENPRYEVISMKVVSVSGNVIEFENVFSDGYHDEGESHYLASYTIMKALKDSGKPFLQLTTSYADKNLRFATPEEAEASLKNQFR